MSKDFEKTVNELQTSIMEDARKIYSEKVIERWLNPRNLGKIRNPDGFAKIKGPCGDTMQISFRAKDGRLSKIRFMTDGCASSIAAASMTTELAKGKKVEEVGAISQQLILDALNGLPEESVHCALLASNTLQEAIKNYFDSKKRTLLSQGIRGITENYRIRYKSSKISNEKVELNGKSFSSCEFENCTILLERGETEVSGCTFKNCKLMLKGNAYTVGKIIKLFAGKSRLNVLDMEAPLFEKGERPLQKPANSSARKSLPGVE